MWIRSQDMYHLIDAKNIWIDFFHGFKICCETKCKENSLYTILGRYSTEKKALKVMDMIEDTILKCEAMRTGYAEYDFGAFVFDMPQDSEVKA